jgi:hypothetical protein
MTTKKRAKKSKRKVHRRKATRAPKGLLWNVHIAGPPGNREGGSETRSLFVPNTTGMADVRSVYVAAERAFGIDMDRMLAVPAPGQK